MGCSESDITPLVSIPRRQNDLMMCRFTTPSLQKPTVICNVTHPVIFGLSTSELETTTALIPSRSKLYAVPKTTCTLTTASIAAVQVASSSKFDIEMATESTSATIPSTESSSNPNPPRSKSISKPAQKVKKTSINDVRQSVSFMAEEKGRVLKRKQDLEEELHGCKLEEHKQEAHFRSTINRT